MPRPRFQNLAEEKRLALLEAAAKEFAEYGYEQASLNRILEAGGMSKGAAYYYFDDKADVFITTINHYINTMFMDVIMQLTQLEAEEFWPSFKRIYMEHLLITSTQESWRFGVARALFSASEDVRSHPEIQATFKKISEWVESLIEQGQGMGIIRTDLPKSFVISLAMGLDSSIDNWFDANAASLPAEERERVARQATELMQKLLQSS